PPGSVGAGGGVGRVRCAPQWMVRRGGRGWMQGRGVTGGEGAGEEVGVVAARRERGSEGVARHAPRAAGGAVGSGWVLSAGGSRGGGGGGGGGGRWGGWPPGGNGDRRGSRGTLRGRRAWRWGRGGFCRRGVRGRAGRPLRSGRVAARGGWSAGFVGVGAAGF